MDAAANARRGAAARDRGHLRFREGPGCARLGDLREALASPGGRREVPFDLRTPLYVPGLRVPGLRDRNW